jgi:adenylate cyclase
LGNTSFLEERRNFAVIYRFDAYSLDTETLALKSGTDKITAEPQVFLLLQYLIENRARIVSKDDIINAVWDGRVISDSAIAYAVREARRLVGDDGRAQSIIRTLPRRGFRFVAEVIEEPTSVRQLTTPEKIPVSSDRPSVAVLPFDNMSGDPEQEYFSDGLAEEIITALSKVERLRVIARHSTFQYKGQALDLRRIAEELGVRYVLEGSVRSASNRVRVTAQLIDANDDSHLWAERYDRSVDDLFDIQDEITKEIVTSLRVNLTDGEVARVWARGTNNFEAWQHCVRATELLRGFTPSSYLEARTLAEKAKELDPEYAQAWALLGFTYWWDGRLGYTGDAEVNFARADELAERAMALDDSAPWSIGISVIVAGALGRYDEGVKIARRGIELLPGNADVRAFLAIAFMHAGNFREAVEHFRAAMLLNPFYPNWCSGSLARTLMLLDEFDEALALLNEGLEREPANVMGWLYRAYIYQEIGRETDARKAIAEVRRLAPDLRVGHTPGLLMINDEAASKRFSDGVRAAGLPE